jgi:hypothetical protein
MRMKLDEKIDDFLFEVPATLIAKEACFLLLKPGGTTGAEP